MKISLSSGILIGIAGAAIGYRIGFGRGEVDKLQKLGLACHLSRDIRAKFARNFGITYEDVDAAEAAEESESTAPIGKDEAMMREAMQQASEILRSGKLSSFLGGMTAVNNTVVG